MPLSFQTENSPSKVVYQLKHTKANCNKNFLQNTNAYCWISIDNLWYHFWNATDILAVAVFANKNGLDCHFLEYIWVLLFKCTDKEKVLERRREFKTEILYEFALDPTHTCCNQKTSLEKYGDPRNSWFLNSWSPLFRDSVIYLLYFVLSMSDSTSLNLGTGERGPDKRWLTDP